MGSYEIDAPVLYVRHTRSLLFVAIPVFAALMAMTPAICEVWVGGFRPQFVIMGVWLTLAWFLNTVSAPAYFAYLGQGKLHFITLGHVVMGTINILAGFFLGEFFGWQGVLVAFVCALVLGSLIPVWTYHIEHQIKASRVFSTPDMISAGVCFGLAAISLELYIEAIDAIFLSTWPRAIIAMLVIGAVSISAFWLHPLRRKVLIFSSFHFRPHE
jgi:O-antigen/teichoic acid export membrane protein